MIQIDIPSGVKEVQEYVYNEEVAKFLDKIDTKVSEKTSEILSGIGEGLQPLMNGLTETAAAITKMQFISNLVPVDLSQFPTFNLEALFATDGGFINSAKQIALAAWVKLKDEANKLAIYVINQGFDALDELFDTCMREWRDQIVSFIEEHCEEYTGYTYVEIMYLCSQGIQLASELGEIVKSSGNKVKFPEKLSKKETYSLDKQLALYDENGKTKGKIEGISDELQETETTEEDRGKKASEKAKEIANYARSLSTPLFNAFNLIMLKICSENVIDKMSVARTTFNQSMLDDALNLASIITNLLSTDLGVGTADAVSGTSLNAKSASIENYENKSKSVSGKNMTISIIDKTKGEIKITLLNDPNKGKTKREMLAKLKEMELFDIASINNIINDSKSFYESGTPTLSKQNGKDDGLQYVVSFEKKEEESNSRDEDSEEFTSTVDITQVVNSVKTVASPYAPKQVSKVLQTTLQTVMKLLQGVQPIATLIYNYKINKEYVREFAARNNEILSSSQRKTEGAEEIDVSGKNSYIIRTQDMYDIFCMVLEREEIEERDVLSKSETNKMIKKLSLHGYDCSGIQEDKETEIFIHIDGGKDGSFAGTKFDYYRLMGKVVENIDGVSSQIMRCMHSKRAVNQK